MLGQIACAVLLLLPLFAWSASPVDELLLTNPAVEAERAFAAGDKRHILIPVCSSPGGEVIPGWPIQDSPEIRTAMEHGRRPISCNDLGVDPGSKRYLRLSKYAEIFNQTLLRLEGKPVGETNPDPDDCSPNTN